jgi:hypothetical protein
MMNVVKQRMNYTARTALDSVLRESSHIWRTFKASGADKMERHPNLPDTLYAS